MSIEIWFDFEYRALTVYYYDGGHRPFKEKTHLCDKRAYNAIMQTIANKGFKM